MNYVRTKDGIFKVRPRFAEEYFWENSVYVCEHEHIENKDILNQGDTIEELCDKFVIVWSNATYYEIYDDFEDVEDWYYGEGVKAIYGAIWTDKGLIFVAQLNNKRKLDLL